MSTSCLVRNFSRYAELSERDIAFLLRFEEKPEHVAAGEDVITQGLPSDHLYVLSKGWCYVKYEQPDGSRQILDVCHGGDIVGMRDVCFQHAICGMRALTDSVLCAFPKAYLSEMFSEHPRLTGILFLAGMRREALLIERVVNLGRRTAYARLCHFLSEMRARAEHVSDDHTTDFDVPMPAPMLADILGMSEIHVYRMLRRLADDKLAAFDNGRFHGLDHDGLSAVSNFSDGYLLLDKSWLPAR